MKGGQPPQHLISWAPADWLTSRVRSRSAMTGDPMLRTVYFELLNVLYANDGEVTAEPVALADLLLLPTDDVGRCLPMLASLGSISLEDGVVRQPRVSRELERYRGLSLKRKEAALVRWGADEKDNAKATWLTPYGAAWETALGGTPPWKELARAFKTHHDKVGGEVLLAGWKRYLAETEGRYASPSSFAKRVGLWVRRPAPALIPPPALPPRSSHAAQLWSAACELVDAPPHLKHTWFSPIQGWGLDANGLLLLAPTKEHQNALIGRYRDKIEAALAVADSQHRTIKFHVAVVSPDALPHDGGL